MRNKILLYRLVSVAAALTLTLGLLGGCGKKEEKANELVSAVSHVSEEEEDVIHVYSEENEEGPEMRDDQIRRERVFPEQLRIGAVPGVGSCGFGFLMESSENKETAQRYEIQLAEDEQAVAELLLQGEIDIALLPPMKAVRLSYENDIPFRVIGITALSNLICVSGNHDLGMITDLAGKTVYMSGQGTALEAAMRYVLNMYLLEDVDLVFVSSEEEVITKIQENADTVGVVGMERAAELCTANSAFTMVCRLADSWNSTPASAGSQMVNTLALTTQDFIDAYPDSVDVFLHEYAEAVFTIDGNLLHGAELMLSRGILDNQETVSTVLEGHTAVAMKNSEMKNALQLYYESIYEMDPQLFGEVLPGEEFYYVNPETEVPSVF